MLETSEQLNELFKAMAEFQKEVEQPKKDADNPFFKSKYVPLENVIDAIHKAGSKHGLSEITYPVQSDGQVGVGVIITHSSGQYMKLPPVLLKPDKNTPQGIGSAITYARRYALSAVFGIASETDDDGNSISGNGNEKQPNRQAQQPKTVSKTQINVLEGVFNSLAEQLGKSTKETKETILKAQKMNSDLTKLTSAEYGLLLNYINKLIEVYKNKAKENLSKQPTSVKKEESSVEQESILDRYGNPK